MMLRGMMMKSSSKSVVAMLSGNKRGVFMAFVLIINRKECLGFALMDKLFQIFHKSSIR
jgi:hypothetical protein